MNPRHFWLALYLTANVYAIVYTLSTGELVGDLDGFSYNNNSVVIWVGIATLLSYVGFLTVGFDSLYKRFRLDDAPSTNPKAERLMGIVVVTGQILFLLFNIAFGLNKAGSTEHVNTALYLIWIVFPFDLLAPIYCAQSSSSRIRSLNLAVFVISNLARGWSGPLLVVFSIEWIRAYRAGTSRFSKYVFPTLIPLGLILYPIILTAKWFLRATDESIGSFIETLHNLPSPTSGDYGLLLQSGIHQLMGRLQIVSNVVDLWAHIRTVQSDFLNRHFMPFWMEGLQGLISNRLTGQHLDYIGIYFTDIGDFPDRLDVDTRWNTNTGWIGWFIVCPHLIPLYLLYTFVLCYVSVRLMVLTSRSKVSRDFLWIIWMLYLLPGWLGAFTGFVYAQFVYLGIRQFCARMSAGTGADQQSRSVAMGDAT